MTYHNSGHHKDVATPNDLTTAKKGKVSIHSLFNHKLEDTLKLGD